MSKDLFNKLFPCYDCIDVGDILRIAVSKANSMGHGIFNIEHIVFGCMKFCEITNCIENEGYLNFNGEPVSIKYLEKTPEGVWVCTEEYLRLFLEKLQIYTTQRKQKVVICGTQECTGLAGEKNAPKS